MGESGRCAGVVYGWEWEVCWCSVWVRVGGVLVCGSGRCVGVWEWEVCRCGYEEETGRGVYVWVGRCAGVDGILGEEPVPHMFSLSLCFFSPLLPPPSLSSFLLSPHFFPVLSSPSLLPSFLPSLPSLLPFPSH